MAVTAFFVLVLLSSLGSATASVVTLFLLVRLGRSYWTLQNMITLLGRALMQSGRSFQTTVVDQQAMDRALREGETVRSSRPPPPTPAAGK